MKIVSFSQVLIFLWKKRLTSSVQCPPFDLKRSVANCCKCSKTRGMDLSRTRESIRWCGSFPIFKICVIWPKYLIFIYIFFPLVLKLFSYSVGNFLMRTVLFEDDPSPSLKRNLSYPNDQENCTKFTASPASSVGLQDSSETAFWHWDLPLTSVVSMTEKPKSTFPSLQILLIGKIILGQGFFCSCWDSGDLHGRDEWGI